MQKERHSTPHLLTSFPKVVKHGNRWNLVYYVNGKMKREYLGNESLNERQAEQKALPLLARLFQETLFERKETLRELLQKAWDVHVLELRANTVGVFNCIMRKFMRFIKEKGFADTPAEQVDETAIEAYRVERLKAVNPNTVRKELSVIKAVYNRLNREGKIKVDTKKVVCKRGEEKVKTVYDPDELQTLFDYAEKHEKEMHLLYCLVFYGFIRPIEAMRLQWSDVDLENRHITLPGTKSKNKKTESVTIPEPLFVVLSKMKNADKTAYLMPTFAQNSRTMRNGYHDKIRRATGLKQGLTIYALKHTGVQQVYRQTNDIKLIQRMCRHGNSSVTDKYLKSLRFDEIMQKRVRELKW
jgi:integrase